MAAHHMFLFGSPGDARTSKPGKPVRLPGKIQNDVFLNALLEMPTTKRTRRNPLEWAGAMGLHIAVIAALVIVPLYTTATIHFSKYNELPLVVAPPPPPPAAPAAGAVAPHVPHPNARLNYTLRKLVAPTSLPKRVSDNVADAAPDPGVEVGVPGGVVGGQIGGVIGGVLGGTGTSAPPPPASPRREHQIVRVGSNLKPPRQTYNVEPQYPDLARQIHLSGTVVVDAVIDEHGNVVQARVVNGHPLLIDAALRAVRQWKYEPTTLNGQPVSVELQVQVHFNVKQ